MRSLPGSRTLAKVPQRAGRLAAGSLPTLPLWEPPLFPIPKPSLPSSGEGITLLALPPLPAIQSYSPLLGADRPTPVLGESKKDTIDLVVQRGRGDRSSLAASTHRWTAGKTQATEMAQGSSAVAGTVAAQVSCRPPSHRPPPGIAERGESPPAISPPPLPKPTEPFPTYPSSDACAEDHGYPSTEGRTFVSPHTSVKRQHNVFERRRRPQGLPTCAVARPKSEATHMTAGCQVLTAQAQTFIPGCWGPNPDSSHAGQPHLITILALLVCLRRSNGAVSATLVRQMAWYSRLGRQYATHYVGNQLVASKAGAIHTLLYFTHTHPRRRSLSVSLTYLLRRIEAAFGSTATTSGDCNAIGQPCPVNHLEGTNVLETSLPRVSSLCLFVPSWAFLQKNKFAYVLPMYCLEPQ